MDRIRSNEKFSYHLGNKCYKSYTHKLVLEKTERKRICNEILSSPEESNETEFKIRVTRSKVPSTRSFASPYITKKDKLYSIKCIICNKIKYQGILDKYRLCEDIPDKEFLEAVNYIDNDVLLADVDSIERAIAADIHYHKNCFMNYLSRYEKTTTTCVICSSNLEKRNIQIDVNTCSKLLNCSRVNNDNSTISKLSDCFDEINFKLKKSCFAHQVCINNYFHDVTGVYENDLKSLVKDAIA